MRDEQNDEERSEDRGRSARTPRKAGDMVAVISAVVASISSVGGAATYQSVSAKLELVAVGMARLEEKVSVVTKLEDRLRGLEHDVAELRARVRDERDRK